MTANNWYALKVFFNRVFDIEERLKKVGTECYVPVEKRTVMIEGKRKVRILPVIGSLMFVRTTEPDILELQRALQGKLIVYRAPGSTRPAVIPEDEFNIFRLVTSTGGDLALEYFGDERMVCHKGDRVRVTEGKLKGVEGYVKRIRRDRKFMVVIHGVIAVATAYIPPCFLEKVEE